MITEKKFLEPEEQAKMTQRIIEKAKENCTKYAEIMNAYKELKALAGNKNKEEIIAIGTDFLIKQI